MSARPIAKPRPLYELGLLGEPHATVRTHIQKELKLRLKELGLRSPVDVRIYAGPASGFQPTGERCAAALCFHSAVNEDAQFHRLIARGVPLIPVARSRKNFTKDVPVSLVPLNGLALDDTPIPNLVFSLLECAGLLPRQRRVFISYRRQEATESALQLYAELSARGFDVFLDTHKIHPGEHFQEVLWQRLCDCDVLLMLDTKGYFDSRWTDEEFGRALARGLAFVRVGWPRVRQNRRTEIAARVDLKATNFNSGTQRLADRTLKKICEHVEVARTKSVAMRYAQLIETLQRSVVKIGGKLDGITMRRRIIVTLPNKKIIAVYPALGVPTANTLYDATLESHTPPAAVVYDEVGLDDRNWRAHVDWIGGHLEHVVRLVPGYRAGWDFVGWKVP